MRDFWGFLLILFVVAAFLRIDFFFYILYLFAGLAVLTHWWTRRAIRALEFQRFYQDRAFIGEVVPARLIVRNTDWLPIPWVRIHESLPLALTSPAFLSRALTMWPGESVELRYTLDCRRRGRYRLGPVALNAGDVFGFGEASANESQPSYITVYPKIVPLTRLGLPSRSPFVSLPHRHRLFEDPARVRGVRPYQVGDSPRHIHWTATAAVGDLLVKQYEPAIALETLILLNLSESDYSLRNLYNASETGIVAAASILYHLAGAGQAVGLAVNGRDPLSGHAPLPLPPTRGQAQVMRALDILARIEVTPGLPLTDWARSMTSGLAWGSTVVLITPVEPPDSASLWLHLKRAGYSPVLVLTQGPASPAAGRLGIPVALVPYETDVGELSRLS
jgi:uncharacterized protein (DUF58 family)